MSCQSIILLAAAMILAVNCHGINATSFPSFTRLVLPVNIFSPAHMAIDGIITLAAKWCYLCIFVFISRYDLREKQIPNRCILSGIVIWVAASLVSGGSVSCSAAYILKNAGFGLLTAVLAFFISKMSFLVIKRKGLGGGDIKFIFLMTCVLGIEKSLYMLYFACIGAVLFLLIVLKRRDLKTDFSFGPFLALPAAVLMSM